MVFCAVLLGFIKITELLGLEGTFWRSSSQTPNLFLLVKNILHYKVEWQISVNGILQTWEWLKYQLE